jgi:hypothetical protein
MPASATVDVAGCGEAWCRVNFNGTLGFASRGFLGIGGVAMGPTYERGFAYGEYGPAHRYGSRHGYERGYAPGYSESSGYGASVAYGGEREFRGENQYRGQREFLRGEGREGGDRTAARGAERGQSQATEIQGANPMINAKTEAPAGRQERAEVPRRSANANTPANGGTNAANGAGNGEGDHGPNFIGSGRVHVDNHP